MTASRFKSKFEKERKVEKVSLDKLSNSKKSSVVNSVTSKSKTNVKEFASKLNEELTLLWNRFYILNRLSGLYAIVRIDIRNNGTFSYTFLNYSGNTEFDNRLREFLEVQSVKERPNNKNVGIYTIKTTFKIKE